MAGFSSKINLKMPQTPRMSSAGKEDIHGEFQLVYNAVRNLWVVVSELAEAGGGGEGGPAAWGSITGILSDQSDVWQRIESKVAEAPLDGNDYIRRNASWHVMSASGTSSWGGITGTLSSQTDLWNVLQAHTQDITSIYTALSLKIGDAPVDGKSYVRKDGVWVEETTGGHVAVQWGDITGVWQDQYDLFLAIDGVEMAALDAQTDATNAYNLADECWDEILYMAPAVYQLELAIPNKVDEAPKDGKQYARRNGTWVEVQGGGGGTNRGVLPLVTGIPPQLVYQADGELIYIEL